MFPGEFFSSTFFNQVKVSQIDQFIFHYSSALSDLWLGINQSATCILQRQHQTLQTHIDGAVIHSITFSMPSILAIVLLTTAV